MFGNNGRKRTFIDNTNRRYCLIFENKFCLLRRSARGKQFLQFKYKLRKRITPNQWICEFGFSIGNIDDAYFFRLWFEIQPIPHFLLEYYCGRFAGQRILLINEIQHVGLVQIARFHGLDILFDTCPTFRTAPTTDMLYITQFTLIADSLSTPITISFLTFSHQHYDSFTTFTDDTLQSKGRFHFCFQIRK